MAVYQCNIFTDNRRSYTIKHCSNGLSDHDGQILSLPNLFIPSNIVTYIHTRRFDNNATADFHLQLSYEQWDDVFGNDNVNEIFNNFLNTYLRCYYSSFTKKATKTRSNFNHWITTGIKISCKRKREHLLLCRHSSDPNLKTYFKKYCKLLSKVILSAKKITL